MESKNTQVSSRNRWGVACLKDISLKIGSGSTPRGGESSYIPERKNFAFIRSQNVYDFKFDVNGLKFISDEDANKLRGVHLQKDDVLLNITGDGVTFSRCCLVPEEILPAAVNQHVAIIRLDTTKCLPGYLMAYLCLPETKIYIESFNAGGSRRAITKGHIESFEIPLPPIFIQEHISRITLNFLAKQNINAKLNKTLEQMAQTLFKSWFVDFDPVVDNALDADFFEQGLDLPDELLRRAEARKAVRAQAGFKPLPAATRQLFPAVFEPCDEPSLGLGGWVPKGWKVKELGEISSELRRGISPKYVDNGGVLVINQKCIRNHEISYEFSRRHDRENKKIDGREICLGDVLVNSTGVGTLGRIAQVTHLPEPAVVDSHVTVVRVKDTECPLYTFGQLMLSMETKIEQLGEGSTGQTELSRKVLSEQLVVLPPYALTLNIDASFKSFSEKQALNRRENFALARLRDTLLPKLISGELSLDDVELTTQQGAA
ncbi:restriction endonuclease subunit S [Aeromonas dhakensis]|uniref:restriction endonuclease subunit S n=1 Tax=Aeromonas dhakensis TaxID=196024 RepID=UPI003D6B195F